MSLTHGTATKNAILNSVKTQIDAGSGAGQILIYSGSAPGAGNAATGSLLVTITLPKPSYPAAASGSMTLNGTPLSASATFSGNAGYFRFADSAGNVIEEGSCAVSGSDLNFSGGVAIVSGGTVQITSFTLNGPP